MLHTIHPSSAHTHLVLLHLPGDHTDGRDHRATVTNLASDVIPGNAANTQGENTRYWKTRRGHVYTRSRPLGTSGYDGVWEYIMDCLLPINQCTQCTFSRLKRTTDELDLWIKKFRATAVSHSHQDKHLHKSTGQPSTYLGQEEQLDMRVGGLIERMVGVERARDGSES